MFKCPFCQQAIDNYAGEVAADKPVWAIDPEALLAEELNDAEVCVDCGVTGHLIGCDSCHEWRHLICAFVCDDYHGMTAEELPDPWFCRACRVDQAATAAVAIDPALEENSNFIILDSLGQPRPLDHSPDGAGLCLALGAGPKLPILRWKIYAFGPNPGITVTTGQGDHILANPHGDFASVHEPLARQVELCIRLAGAIQGNQQRGAAGDEPQDIDFEHILHASDLSVREVLASHSLIIAHMQTNPAAFDFIQALTEV
jgi:hypothetical protein